MNDDKSSTRFRVNFNELEKQKENLLEIIQKNQLTHFNFDNSRQEPSIPRFNQ